MRVPSGPRLVKAKFQYAIQVADLGADLRVRVVCVSQAGRKLVEKPAANRSATRLKASYLDMSRQLEPVCDRSETICRSAPVCDLDTVVEFGLNRVIIP